MYLLCELFFHYFSLQPFQSVHLENKFPEVLNKDRSSSKNKFHGICSFWANKTRKLVPRKFLSLR